MNISIEHFLAQVEKKAYRMAEIATQNQSDALDIVQDAMIKLIEKYANKPSEQWKPLFYKILQSRINDYFRRKKLHKSIFFWKTHDHDSEHPEGQTVQGSDFITPEREMSGQHNIDKVLAALKSLPHRQQQCFLLRNWEGLSVDETARAMGCSEGSVKTHYSRARESLKSALAEELI